MREVQLITGSGQVVGRSLRDEVNVSWCGHLICQEIFGDVEQDYFEVECLKCGALLGPMVISR